MQTEQFNKIVERRIELIRSVLATKEKEYAVSKDRLHNFNRAAEMLRCTREQALIGFMTKHLVSILDMVDSLFLPSKEKLEEKIGDSVNYLILLEASLKEKIAIAENKQKELQPYTNKKALKK